MLYLTIPSDHRERPDRGSAPLMQSVRQVAGTPSQTRGNNKMTNDSTVRSCPVSDQTSKEDFAFIPRSCPANEQISEEDFSFASQFCLLREQKGALASSAIARVE